MNSIIELPAVKDNLNTVLDFIDSHLAEHGSSMKAQMQIETAVEELFVNIAGYAYSPYTGTVKIEFKCKDGIAWITFNISVILPAMTLRARVIMIKFVY